MSEKQKFSVEKRKIKSVNFPHFLCVARKKKIEYIEASHRRPSSMYRISPFYQLHEEKILKSKRARFSHQMRLCVCVWGRKVYFIERRVAKKYVSVYVGPYLRDYYYIPPRRVLWMSGAKGILQSDILFCVFLFPLFFSLRLCCVVGEVNEFHITSLKSVHCNRCCYIIRVLFLNLWKLMNDKHTGMIINF